MSTTIGTQLDSDRRLLEFKNYEEYLDSLVTCTDFFYLRSTKIVRQLAKLGYRCTGETLDEKPFYRRLHAVRNLLFPVHRPYILTSEFVLPRDKLMEELALRERPNRLYVLSTIVFVRNFTKHQFEVSGYIDYRERLLTEDWQPYFEGKKKLYPRRTDLAYHHWKIGKTNLNRTSNYEPIIDRTRCLLFKNLHDRKLVNVDPLAAKPGIDTTRVRLYSDAYEHVVLYDHVIRR